MKKSRHKHNNYSWRRRLRGRKTQTSSCLGCVHALFLFVCSLKYVFLQLRSIQPLWKRAFCLLCLVDDFRGELMKGDAEGRKQQMRRNKDHSVFFLFFFNAECSQTQLWDLDYCWGRRVCEDVDVCVSSESTFKVGCALLKFLCSVGRPSPSCHWMFKHLNKLI